MQQHRGRPTGHVLGFDEVCRDSRILERNIKNLDLRGTKLGKFPETVKMLAIINWRACIVRIQERFRPLVVLRGAEISLPRGDRVPLARRIPRYAFDLFGKRVPRLVPRLGITRGTGFRSFVQIAADPIYLSKDATARHAAQHRERPHIVAGKILKHSSSN